MLSKRNSSHSHSRASVSPSLRSSSIEYPYGAFHSTPSFSQSHHASQRSFVAYGLVRGGQSNGTQKTCQDEFLIRKMRVGQLECSLFAIIDGHGPDGHFVAQYVKQLLPGELIRCFSKHARRSQHYPDKAEQGNRADLFRSRSYAREAAGNYERLPQRSNSAVDLYRF